MPIRRRCAGFSARAGSSAFSPRWCSPSISAGRSLAAGAIVLLLGLVLVTAFVPRSSSAGRSLAEPEPAPAAWPETGIKRFAAALPDPCFVLDRRGIVRYANERAIARLLDPRRRAADASACACPTSSAAFDRVAKGGPPERVEFAERVPTERWFAAWFAGIDGGDGSPPSFIVLIIDDLTERRRTRAHPRRFRRQCQPRAAHAARLAHRLHRDAAGAGPRRCRWRASASSPSCTSQATRMSRLIDDLLSLSRIEMKAHVRPSGEARSRRRSSAMSPTRSSRWRASSASTIETELPPGPVDRARRPRRAYPGLREPDRERLQIWPGGRAGGRHGDRRAAPTAVRRCRSATSARASPPSTCRG